MAFSKPVAGLAILGGIFLFLQILNPQGVNGDGAPGEDYMGKFSDKDNIFCFCKKLGTLHWGYTNQCCSVNKAFKYEKMAITGHKACNYMKGANAPAYSTCCKAIGPDVTTECHNEKNDP